MRGVFVTGSDTGVGKTIVSCLLTRLLREKGVDAVPMKPIQTGAERVGEDLIAPDFDLCCKAGRWSPDETLRELYCPYLYETACSPHLAAEMSGRAPAIDHILDCANELAKRHEFLIVEGAGGVLVPIDEAYTMRDLMKALGFPVVLVVRGGLGTINHSLLSLEALRSANIETLGLVLNDAETCADDFIRKDNPKTIERMGKSRVLGDLRFEDGLLSTDTLDETLSHMAPGFAEAIDIVLRETE